MNSGLTFLDTDFSQIKAGQIKPGSFLYGADINNGRLFTKMDSNLVKTVIEGGSGGLSAILPITYAALRTAMTGSTLVAGQMYVITDFTTIYDQPDFDNAGNPKLVVTVKTSAVEPLVIQSISTSAISSTVFSPSFPFDQIQYNVLFDTTEHMAAPAKGRISQRIDVNQNTTDYDSRTILFKRYESAPGSGIFNVVNDNAGATSEQLTFGTGCLNNNLGVFAIFQSFGFAFILSNNILGNNCDQNIAESVFMNSTFLNACSDNTMGISVFYLNLGTSSNGNVFNAISNFTVGNSCQTNTIGDFCTGSIGDNNNNNIIGNSNSIGFSSNCSDNKIGGNNTVTTGVQFNSNNIGNFNNITAGLNCSNNTLQNNNIIVFIDSFQGNFIENSNQLTLGNNCIKNTFKSGNNLTFRNGNNNNNIGHNNSITLRDSNNDNTISNDNTITGNDFNVTNIIGINNVLMLADNAESNIFGNANNLTIPTSSTLNNFGNGNINATFNAPLQGNNFNNGTVNTLNFAAATHVYAAYTKNNIQNAAFSAMLTYFDNANVLTVVAPNA